MKNSTQARRLPVIGDDLAKIVPGVPAMNHNRQLQFAGKLELSSQYVELGLAVRVVIEVIQADFAEGQNLGGFGQETDFIAMCVAEVTGLVGMDPNRRIDPIVLFRNGKRGAKSVRCGASADCHDTGNPGSAGSFNDRVAVRVEGRVVQVSMGINEKLAHYTIEPLIH